MKKIFLMLLSIMLVCSMLFFGLSCKEEAAAEETTEEETVEEAAEEEAAEEEVKEEAMEEDTEETEASIPVPEGEVTLDYWLQDGGAVIAAGEEYVASFEAKYPNIDINIVPISFADLRTKIVSSVYSGTEGDIVYGQTQFFMGIDRKELFLPLSPELYTAEEFEDKVAEISLKHDMGSDGEIYSISFQDGGNGIGITLNKNMLEEAGVEIDSLYVEPFETYEDLINVAKEAGMITHTSEITAFVINNALTNGLAGNDLLDAETGIWDLDQPEIKEAMELLKSFVDEGALDLEVSEYLLDFGNELHGMLFLGPWSIGNLGMNFPDLETAYSLLPIFQGGKDFKYWARSFATVALSKRLEEDMDKKNAGLLFMKYVLDDPAFIEAHTHNNNNLGVSCLKSATELLGAKVEGGTATEEEELFYNLSRLSKGYVDIGTMISAGLIYQNFYDNALPYLKGETTIEESINAITEALNASEEEARL